MAPSNPDFPSRLVEGDDRAALLVQRALAEPVLGPSEQQAWRRLRDRSKPAAPRWLLPAAAFALSMCALLVWWSRPTPAPPMAPDVWSRVPVSPPHALLGAPGLPEKAAETPEKPSERAKPLARAASEDDANQCAKLAKDAKYADAVGCYGRIAGGSSMSAELALYEKARIEAKALGQSSVALRTLDEHQRRFPSGVLSTEVELTRIELLSQLGRRGEALAAIERGLQSALGRERGGDLQVLRADLLVTQGDCVAALEAVRLARQAGVHPSRLSAIERRCPAPAVSASPSDSATTPSATPAAAATEGAR